MITMPRLIAWGIYLLFMCVSLPAQSDSLRAFMPDFFAEFPNVRDLALSTDGKEMFFTVESFKKEFSAIYYSKKAGKKWSKPVIAPFSGQFQDLEPFFSPDNQQLLFVSRRPVSPDSTQPKDADVWVVQREGNGWSQPQNLVDVNTQEDEFYPSMTRSGNIYLTRVAENPANKEDIHRCEARAGGGWQTCESVQGPNTERYEFNAFVDPEEKVMLFTSYGRADDLGGGDLYVSYHREGQWSTAEHLPAPYNSKKIDYCPFWDVQHNLFYFTSERSAMPSSFQHPRDAQQLQQQMTQPANGLGRIYCGKGIFH